MAAASVVVLQCETAIKDKKWRWLNNKEATIYVPQLHREMYDRTYGSSGVASAESFCHDHMAHGSTGSSMWMVHWLHISAQSCQPSTV
jgi:hypothetical protein